jgi:membrane protein implicated in regulation of membrane protease activity
MDILLEPARFAALAWLIIGFALCAVETLVPGAFFIWFGGAAVVVGAVAYFVPMYLKTQLLFFAILVGALVLVGRRVYGSRGADPGPLPQSRAHELIGKDFFLEEPIERGYGRIRVGDSSWRVAGEDCPLGAKVRVVAVEDGSLLKVEPVDDSAAPGLPQR